jgi:sporulation protein YlmC with PRC-barrel domain
MRWQQAPRWGRGATAMEEAMRKFLFTTALIAPFLMGSALAQDPPETEAPAAPAVEDTAAPAVQPENGAIIREQAPNELRVDWITGTRVRSLEGQNIGRIRDLIIDAETHAISAAILSVGGFLGVGAKEIAVKFEELVIDFDARVITLDLTREAAEAAPEYIFRDRAQRRVEEPMDAAPAPLN